MNARGELEQQGQPQHVNRGSYRGAWLTSSTTLERLAHLLKTQDQHLVCQLGKRYKPGMKPVFPGGRRKVLKRRVPPKKAKAPEFKYLAANVAEFRRKLGMSQAQLAERANLDVTSLSLIERAGTNITLQTLLDLAEALGVPPALLLTKARFKKAAPGRPPKAP